MNGVYLPGSVEVAYNQHSTQRRKEFYGDDVDVFRPERWLDAAPERLSDGGEKLGEMERTLELVFGTGRFGCLGRDVAMMELSKVFPSLLASFEWGIVDPVRPMSTICWGVHVQTDLWLWARERRK